jgi:putative ABC transport system permease protein
MNNWFRFFSRRKRMMEDLDQDIHDFIERETQDNIERGMPPDEAHYAALRKFGNAVRVKEETRDVWSFNWLEQLWQDTRFGIRMLVGNPGFAAVAVLSLALGIGVNSTIFSVVSTMLLRKPPVKDPDGLMVLSSKNVGAVGAGDEASRSPVSPPDFLDWRAQATAFSEIAAASSFENDIQATLSGGNQPERVPSGEVSANYFQVLGVSPLLGRAFLPGEDQSGHDRVALLRADLWESRFGADPHVLGRTVKVNGDTYTIIGVMPDTLRSFWMFPEQLWIPLVFTPAQLSPAARAQRNLSVFGRLKPGVSEAQARSELETIAQRIARSNPETNKDWGANVLTVQQFAIQESNSRTALMFLMAVVGFVLVIACANVASLLVARNAARQREFAVRAALGAGGFRLARQLLSECLLLALLGGGLGLVFAAWGLHFLRGAFNWNEWSVLIAEQLSIDRNVLLFTLAVSAVSAMIFGLAPAFQISRRDPNAGLKQSSRSATAGLEHHRLQNLLVAAQLALSLILLVGAGLFVENFLEEMQEKPGMNPHNLLTATVVLTGAGYKDAARQAAFSQNVLRQLSGIPAVQSAAISTDLPYTFPGYARIAVEGRPGPKTEQQAQSAYFAVSPGYFHAAQISLREGREFTLADNNGSVPVAIVNEEFAKKFFPSENPMGRHIGITHPDEARSGSMPTGKWSEIVGVARNVNEYVGQRTPRPQVFEPFLQRPDPMMRLLVRTRTEPAAFASPLRGAIYSVDKDQPVTDLRTMDRVLQDSGQGDNIMAELMAAFAGIALAMAAVGIYGLIAYLVGRRIHEVGVRMALGASRREVLLMVLRGSMRMVLAGVAFGFLVSLMLPRLVAATFQDVHMSYRNWIIAGTPLAVMLVALASSYLPARRAAKVDPNVALRYE